MKILHTADWHIGKRIFNVHLTNDQEYVLEELFKIIEDEKPDVLIIAGDVYDRSIPPVEAVELLDRTFTRLITEYNMTVIVTAGNHDSPDRLSFASQILAKNKIHIIGNIEKQIQPIKINDPYGTVNFFPVPFVEHAKVRELFEDETIKGHDQAMKTILSHMQVDYKERNICIAHGFITGAESLETSESERPLSIGGTEYIDVEYFKKFDYVALGHLHQGQKVKYDNIRYSGSLYKYSFSETSHKKGVMLIELKEKGNISIGHIPLEPRRDLRKLTGELDDILSLTLNSSQEKDDYMMVTLTNREPLLEPLAALRTVFPNVLRLEIDSMTDQAGENRTSAGENIEKLNTLELFTEFYENLTENNLTDEEKNVLIKTIEKCDREERNQ
jgi:exonuclease SbcD